MGVSKTAQSMQATKGVDAATKIASHAAALAGVGLSVYDALRASPADVGWGRKSTAAVRGVLKDADNVAVGMGSAALAASLLVNPIGIAALALTLGAAYGLYGDKHLSQFVVSGVRSIYKNLLKSSKW